jgi:predicted RNA polymerase sigma factor
VSDPTTTTASAATVDVHRVVDAVWRMESAKLVGALTRVTGDVGLAEELAQDALVAALEQWPAAGVPDRPGAWLMATAKHRAIDTFRRAENLRRKTAELGRELVEAEEPDWAAALDEVVERIVRAKRTLTAARVPFEVPTGEEFTARLSSALEVIYLIFNEGYSATAGEDWIRPTLCQEALRLGRILAELTPGESEVHGLAALMEIQASRLRARVGPGGEPVLLGDQYRGRWDRVLIGRGLAALDRAQSVGGSLGPYSLQASIAACHARARSVEETDWARIAALYEALAELTPSPVVELNRAVAVSRAYGPAAGLELVDRLGEVAALRGYHLLPSVRADLLEQLGRLAEARAEFEEAASLTRNERERALLLDRAAACAGATPELG